MQTRCFFWKSPKALQGRGNVIWKLTAHHGAKGRWAHLPAPGSPCPYLPLPPGWGHPEPPHARASRGTPLELPYVHDSDFSAAATTEEPALDTGREGGPRKQGANVQEEAPSAAQTTSCRGFILTCLPLRSVFINSARPQRLPEPQLWAPLEPCGETAAALNL